MQAAVGIFLREVSQRRDLFVLASAVALLVSILPWLITFDGERPGDIREGLALAFSLAAGVLLAVGLGATLFGRDLSEKRLGFYFARPVSGLSIWIGRMAAVYLLILACEAIILLPVLLGVLEGPLPFMVIRDVFSGGAAEPYGLVAVFLLAPALLLGVAHAVSVMTRARTPWIFLDLLGAVAVVPTVWLILRPFVAFGFDRAVSFFAWELAAVFIATPLIAGAVGVIVGRTDARRTHAGLSVAFWTLLIAALASTAGYAHWLLNFSPMQTGSVSVMNISPDGRWLEIHGTGWARQEVSRVFLVSVNDGRWYPLPVRGSRWSHGEPSTVFSENGGRVVWLADGDGDQPRAIFYADLDSAELEPVATTLAATTTSNVALSPDGVHLLIAENRLVSIFSLKDERLVTAARNPTNHASGPVSFVDANTVRFYSQTKTQSGDYLAIAELDISTGGMKPTARVLLTGSYQVFRIHPDLKYVAVRFYEWETRDLEEWTVYDGRDGDELKTIRGELEGFLGDSILWTTRSDGGRQELVVESAVDDDREVHHLGRFTFLGLAGNGLEDGCFVSPYSEDYRRGGTSEIFYADFDTGEKHLVGRDIALEWSSYHRYLLNEIHSVYYSTTTPARNEHFHAE